MSERRRNPDLPWHELEELLELSSEEANNELQRRYRDRPSLRKDFADFARFVSEAEDVPYAEFGFRRATVPSKILDYSVKRELGRGAHGVVYLAETEEPGKRDVAIKVQRRSSFLDEEIKILAALSHERIARLHQCRNTDVHTVIEMEYVDGPPLLEAASELDLEGRIRLLIDVCEGVAAAHSHLVVHRDIKPSNVLTTKAGRAKIVDFGVAGLLDRESRDGASPPGGTLPFMSPETLRGGKSTTQADVYSIGVLACQLLADEHPFAAATTREEILEAAASSECRVSELFRRLPRDLAAIVGKAMAYSADDRYEAAAEMAEDLRRFLRHEPVRARDASLWHRSRLSIRRNRVGAIIAAIAALAVGYIVVDQMRVAIDRKRAEVEDSLLGTLIGNASQVLLPDWRLESIDRGQDQAAEDILETMLTAANPEVTRGQVQGALRKILEQAWLWLNSRDWPAQRRVRLANTIGETYYNLGEFDLAQVVFRQSLAWSSTLDLEERIISHNNLAVVLQAQGKLNEAETILREGVEVRRAELGETHPNTVKAINNLAVHFRSRGMVDVADSLYRDAIATMESVGVPDSLEWLKARSNWALVLRDRDEWLAARDELESVVRQLMLEPGEDHPVTMVARANLAATLLDLGEYERSVSLGEQTLVDQIRVIGPDHKDVLGLRNTIGVSYYHQGNLDEAANHFRESRRISQETLGVSHATYLGSTSNLASIERALGNYDTAVELFREVIAGRTQLFGVENLRTQMASSTLAATLLDVGRAEEALSLATEAAEIMSKQEVAGPRHSRTLAALLTQALALEELDRPQDAVSILDRVVAGARESRPQNLQMAGRALAVQATCLLRANRTAEAQSKLAEAESILRESGAGRPSDLEDLDRRAQEILDIR